MRAAKPSIVIGVIVALAFSTVAVAGALISGASGNVIRLSSPPSSVAVNALEDGTNAVTFDERRAVTLTAAVVVDAIDPGTYTVNSTPANKVAAGRVVDSNLIHSDPPAGGTVRRTGSVTFATDIVGVISSTDRLGTTDASLGAPGTTYAGKTKFRGLEPDSASGQDTFTISADRRTVSIDVRTTSVVDDIRVLTKHVDSLSAAIFDTPDPVTAGNDVQYTIVVTNAAYSNATNASVTFSWSPGTFKSATAPNGCTSTSTTATCAVGNLAPGANAIAKVVVTTPSSVPESGTIDTTALPSPGSNVTATESTAVEAPSPGVSKGFVGPGGSIETDGDDPATVTLPPTGPGAPILITQGPGTFCDGPCSGTATEISDFPGYSDPSNPIRLHLVYTFPSSPTSLTDAATAFGATIYKNDDPGHPSVGVPVADCAAPGSGNATPHPCVDAHTITQPSSNSFVVTFDILYLSGDPRFAKR
jgi:uncharacterized repeat protein (TIGR01451 family)